MTLAAIVGGTASKLGGGKFANGAVSGAFVHMYNYMAHDPRLNGKVARAMGGDGGITDSEAERNDVIVKPVLAVNVGVLAVIRYGFKATAEFIFAGILQSYSLDTGDRLRKTRPPSPPSSVSQTKNTQKGVGKGKWSWIF